MEVDDRYVTYREHSELKQEVMTLRAKLEALPDEVRELRRDIAALKDLVKQPAGGADQLILSLHRLLDASKSSQSPVERIIALIGAVAIGGLGFKLLGLGA
jgi:cell division septum initiation protein DivIVA